MNELLSRIAKEWERTVLVALCLLVAVIGGIYVYGLLNPDELEQERPKPRRPLPDYYALKYLDGVPSADMKNGVNPMACEFVKPEPPKPVTPPWRKPEVAKPAQQPKPEVKPAPQAQQQKPQAQQQKPQAQQQKPQAQQQKPPKAEPAKPKPKPKPPRVIELRYVGNMSIAGGTSAAQLYVSEVVSKKQRNSFKTRLKENEKILGGLLVISSFDKSGVVLTHSGGKKVKVPIGQAKATVVKIPQQ